MTTKKRTTVKLGAKVRLVDGNYEAEIVGLAMYTERNTLYLARWENADGFKKERWLTIDEIKTGE